MSREGRRRRRGDKQAESEIQGAQRNEEPEPENQREVISLHQFGSELEVKVTERASEALASDQIELEEFIEQHLVGCESIGDRHALGGYRMRRTIVVAQILSVHTSLMLIHEYGEFAERWGTHQPDPAYVATFVAEDEERQRRSRYNAHNSLATEGLFKTAEDLAVAWGQQRHERAKWLQNERLLEDEDYRAGKKEQPDDPKPQDFEITAEEVQRIVTDELHPEHWEMMRWWMGTPAQLRTVAARRNESQGS